MRFEANRQQRCARHEEKLPAPDQMRKNQRFWATRLIFNEKQTAPAIEGQMEARREAARDRTRLHEFARVARDWVARCSNNFRPQPGEKLGRLPEMRPWTPAFKPKSKENQDFAEHFCSLRSPICSTIFGRRSPREIARDCTRLTPALSGKALGFGQEIENS